MAGLKTCYRCGMKFSKPEKYSPARWRQRKYCSDLCRSAPETKNDTIIQYLYAIENKSSTEIGLKFNISGTQVLRILKRNNVKIRPASENKKLALNKPETKEKIRASSTGRKLAEAAKDKLRKQIGGKNANWKNGLTMSTSGYLTFTNSIANGEHANKALHTIIAEWKIGRKLEDYECVHHNDRKKLNNEPDNLIVMTKSDHAIIHTGDRENGKLK